MSRIETHGLGPHEPGALWPRVAGVVRSWLDSHRADPRDACVLLPFAELLAPSRQAFAQTPGWLPRIHTTRTLARECAPLGAEEGDGLAPCGHAALDRLAAARLLRSQRWAAGWARSDRRAFDHALTRLVRSTHVLMRGAASTPPREREAFWLRARAVLAPGSGGFAIDAALQRVALEWAASAAAPATDRLFARRASAWVSIELGGDDAIATAVLEAAEGVPCLRVRADADGEDPFDALPLQGRIDASCAVDAEDEAWAAAQAVTAAIADGRTPVALIAEDRALVRRIRALLERSGVRIDDETGWSLATTRAGAEAMCAIRAAHPAARPDDRLDWLKSRSAGFDADALATLEASWRRARAVDAQARARSEALWQHERRRLDELTSPPRKALAAWLRALDALLFGPHAVGEWLADPAAEQLRRALMLDNAGVAQRGALLDSTLDLDEFAEWTERCLEDARYMPPPGAEEAQVVLTPLARAIGRRFGCAVLPGADERRLALAGHHDDLLFGDAALRAMGLPDQAARRRRQALAFVQLLRLPQVVFVRRRSDGDEALAPSPLLDRLLLARRGDDPAHALQERGVTVSGREIVRRGIERPLPTAIGRLGASWSASAVEALRQCPYRFFARSVLRLERPDELDDEADKSDYGRWLHKALERFHADRGETADAVAANAERLERIGRDQLQRMIDAGEVSEAALLPYAAGLRAFAHRYAQWLHEHEAQGWRFDAAEVECSRDDGAASALCLHGRIDRIDVGASGALKLIDYKTSAREALTRKVALPLEDTQLAVYAALVGERLAPGVDVTAAYLALDDTDGVREVVHADVATSARRLVAGLADERRRLEAGAPLPALGQGAVCDTCEARGLCRRDHWSA